MLITVSLVAMLGSASFGGEYRPAIRSAYSGRRSIWAKTLLMSGVSLSLGEPHDAIPGRTRGIPA